MKKREMLDIVASLQDVNSAITKINSNQMNIADILADCQNSAILLGTSIEEQHAKTFRTATDELIRLLESYCENLYQFTLLSVDQSALIPDEKSAKKLAKKIQKELSQIHNIIKYDLPDNNKEIVFLPYKASMWDSLESIWRAADADENCDAYVIPIPYYDKNPDGSIREEHYEGDLYPEYVPITHYMEHDLEKRRPDIIFFHNPYDNYNKVTSVHPFYFSSNLKKYTDKLVYVPYYVVPGVIPEDFVLTPGVMYADIVFVQNQRIRTQYIRALTDNVYHQEYQPLQEKIVAIGSPKTDRFFNIQTSEREIPDEWRRLIGKRKVCFFNTNISLILNNDDHFSNNLERIFHIFEMYKNDFVLLWREHPLTMETLNSMRPELKDSYLKCREKFLETNLGILDTTSDPHLAMEISDCYFGAGGSLVTIYSVTGKPMMITAYQYPSGISEEKITKEEFYDSIQRRSYYKEEHINSLQLFLDNFDEIATFREHRLEVIARCLDNLDGSVGEKIYRCAMEEIQQ